MKRRIWYAALMAAMILGLLSGCGSSPGGSDVVPGVEGKILNIYVWNDEFQGKFNANYPEIDHLSNDKSVTFLKDGDPLGHQPQSGRRLSAEAGRGAAQAGPCLRR